MSNVTTPNAGSNMQQRELSFIASGDPSFLEVTLEDSLAIYYKAKSLLLQLLQYDQLITVLGIFQVIWNLAST